MIIQNNHKQGRFFRTDLGIFCQGCKIETVKNNSGRAAVFCKGLTSPKVEVGRFEKGAKKKRFGKTFKFPATRSFVHLVVGRGHRPEENLQRYKMKKKIKPETNSLESCWLFTVAVTGHCQLGERQSKKKLEGGYTQR